MSRRHAATRGGLVAMLVAACAPSARAQDADGAALFHRRCGTCHAVVPGEARQGPNLAGVWGRRAGGLPGYDYSPGFAGTGWAWDEPHLDAYLANPQAVIEGSVMGYRLSDAAQRRAIVAYLSALPR